MNIAIILSGGVGTRMGASIPKQYIEVCGKPVIYYSLIKFVESGSIDAYIIALDNQWKEYVEGFVSKIHINKPLFYSVPGETREHTIYNALKCAKQNGYADDDIVIIHDAVRPMVSKEVIDDCLEGCKNYDAAIAVIDVKDTIYQSLADNCVTGGAQFAANCGLKVYLSKGAEINFKLTTPEDLQRFEQIINNHQ